MRFLLLLLLVFPVSAADVINNSDGSVTVIISQKEMLECEKKGGCILISIQDVHDIAQEAALHMCGRSVQWSK